MPSRNKQRVIQAWSRGRQAHGFFICVSSSNVDTYLSCAITNRLSRNLRKLTVEESLFTVPEKPIEAIDGIAEVTCSLPSFSRLSKAVELTGENWFDPESHKVILVFQSKFKVSK